MEPARALRHALTASLLVFGVSAAAPASGQEAFCADPTAFCGRTVDATCLTRFGAGTVAAVDPQCAGQLSAYRDCLSLVAKQCKPASVGGQPSAAEGQMLEIWNEVKESGDPEALEAFAAAYPTSPLATLAANRAAALRAETTRPAALDPDDQNGVQAAPPPDPAVAAAAWSAVRQSWSASDVQAFLAAHPESAEASSAKARLAEIKAANREAQTHLNRIGHNVGAVDGVWGAGSARGMRAFESSSGLPQTGAVSPDRLALLREAPTAKRAAPPANQPPARIETPRKDQAALTVELRVNIKLYRQVDKNCRIRLDTPDRALRLDQVRLDCGAPLALSLATTPDGELLRGHIFYDRTRLPLNGYDWGYSARPHRTRNTGEPEMFSVRVLFLD